MRGMEADLGAGEGLVGQCFRGLWPVELAVCKTAGSAYVGSNPTPATENPVIA
jgi:hypothetical protein